MRLSIRNYQTLILDNEYGGGIHPYHELLYISSGKANLEWVDFVCKVDSPALFLIPKNTPHRLCKESPELQYSFVEFSLEDDAGCFPNDNHVIKWNTNQTRPHKETLFHFVFYSFHTLMHTFNRLQLNCSRTLNRIAQLELEKVLLCITNEMESLESYPKQPCNLNRLHGTKQTIVNEVMRQLELRYRDVTSLNTLAGYVNVTPSYLIRIFKELTGTTPNQYLMELRMNAAVSLLATTNMSIVKISETSGFSDNHYFSRAFRKKFSECPSQWRINHKKK